MLLFEIDVLWSGEVRFLKKILEYLVVLGLAYALFLLGVDLSGYFVTVQPRLGIVTDFTMSFSKTTRPSETAVELVEEPTARNVILLIADGMGFSHLTAARAALVGADERLALERMPITGWLSTHSATRLYTDSAAGATALATGYKTDPGRLSVSLDNQPFRTLLEAARDDGKATGLVTDSYLWDATPAAFASHRESRRDTTGIIDDMAASGTSLMFGETLEAPPEDTAETRQFLAHDGRVAHTIEDLRALPDAEPAIGLFAPGSIAAPNQPPHLPALAEIALARLARNPRGFFLMIETEETDTGSHRGSLERVVRGIETLDRVVSRALEFARSDDQTLVVLTADHETGGLALLLGRDGEKLRARWATRGHTAEAVPILAYGPGAEHLGGVQDNTEVPRKIARILGLEMP